MQIPRVEKVRIETFNEYLHLAEIEVYDSSGTNIALNSEPTAKSVNGNRPAWNGVDGDKESIFVTENTGGELLYLQHHRTQIITLPFFSLICSIYFTLSFFSPITQINSGSLILGEVFLYQKWLYTIEEIIRTVFQMPLSCSLLLMAKLEVIILAQSQNIIFTFQFRHILSDSPTSLKLVVYGDWGK